MVKHVRKVSYDLFANRHAEFLQVTCRYIIAPVLSQNVVLGCVKLLCFGLRSPNNSMLGLSNASLHPIFFWSSCLYDDPAAGTYEVLRRVHHGVTLLGHVLIPVHP